MRTGYFVFLEGDVDELSGVVLVVLAEVLEEVLGVQRGEEVDSLLVLHLRVMVELLLW